MVIGLLMFIPNIPVLNFYPGSVEDFAQVVGPANRRTSHRVCLDVVCTTENVCYKGHRCLDTREQPTATLSRCLVFRPKILL